MAVARIQEYVLIYFNKCILSFTIVGFFDQPTSKKNAHFVVPNLDHQPTYKAETAVCLSDNVTATFIK